MGGEKKPERALGHREEDATTTQPKEQPMDRKKFLDDDRYCRLTRTHIDLCGGDKWLALSRLLDEERDDSCEAVLDDQDRVWTPVRDEEGKPLRYEDGYIRVEWTALDKFEF
jgi:hypothetical protein